MRTSALVLASVLALLAVGSTAATADAPLPSTKKGTAIVLGKSIGKAKLGQSRSAGEAAWGAKAKCGAPDGRLTTCLFGDPKSSLGFGQFGVVGGKVTQIWIRLAGWDNPTNAPQRKTPLARFKTAKGIGLGSTEKQLLKAYPRGTKFTGGNSFTLRVKGPGRAFTDFQLQAGVVALIRIDDGVTGG